MSKYSEIIKKEQKRPLSPQAQEALLTTVGVVFILVLTIGTVFSFESRHERMLQSMETTVIAGARG